MPADVLRIIFLLLPYNDFIGALRLVCKHWRRLWYDPITVQLAFQTDVPLDQQERLGKYVKHFAVPENDAMATGFRLPDGRQHGTRVTRRRGAVVVRIPFHFGTKHGREEFWQAKAPVNRRYLCDFHYGKRHGLAAWWAEGISHLMTIARYVDNEVAVQREYMAFWHARDALHQELECELAESISKSSGNP